MPKSSRSKSKSNVVAEAQDLSQQIEARINVEGKPNVLPPLNGDLVFRRTYVAASLELNGRLRERVLEKPCWKDLRGAPDDKLPSMNGDGFGLWVIEPSSDDPTCPGENAFMGMLYRTHDGQLILARPRSPEDVRLDELVDQYASRGSSGECDCCGDKSDALGDAVAVRDDGVVLISTTNCERSRTVTLSAYVYSGYATTRAAAINAAKTAAQSYADGVARGRGRLESCGAGCRSCSSGSANVTFTDTDSSLSLIASAFYGEWRYSGYAEFNYSFSVGCCRIGPVVSA